jgi:ankyrin repeat protein
VSCKSDSDLTTQEDASCDAHLDAKKAMEIATLMPGDAFANRNVVRLINAARDGKSRVVKELISNGVDVNSLGAGCVTPLFFLIDNINGFETLLSHGASPNAQIHGVSVMHIVASVDNPQFLRAALAHGGDANLRGGNSEMTPLSYAITLYGKFDVERVELLLSNGADPNLAADVFDDPWGEVGGQNSLVDAVLLKRFDVAVLLLEHGADPDAEDVQGNSARSLVEEYSSRYETLGDRPEELATVVEYIRNGA